MSNIYGTKLIYYYLKEKNMVEKNIRQEFRLKNIDETRYCFIEEININELMSTKHKRVCTTLNYVEHLLFLPFAFSGCLSIFAFASIVGIPIGITSLAVGLKVFAVTAGII